ncbi:ribonuclease III [Thermodesulfobacteriota bacterium]
MNALSNKLGYSFRRPDLLEEAFRHSSHVNEVQDPNLRDNERLEFLGDAVLDLAISDILMDLFEEAKEGDLSKYRARVVNERGLCQIARSLELGEYLHLGKGEELSKGRNKPSILADAMEALLGALYLDAGFEKTKQIIHRLFLPVLGNQDFGADLSDYKSLLQEYTQQSFKVRPEYLLIEEIGPAHDRTFEVVLKLNGETIAAGAGKSKKEAEQQAAKEAYYCLKGH